MQWFISLSGGSKYPIKQISEFYQRKQLSFALSKRYVRDLTTLAYFNGDMVIHGMDDGIIVYEWKCRNATITKFSVTEDCIDVTIVFTSLECTMWEGISQVGIWAVRFEHE